MSGSTTMNLENTTMSDLEVINYVTELFPGIPLATIQDIVQLVRSSTPTDSIDSQLENIVNLLFDQSVQEIIIDEDCQEEHLLDEARGDNQVREANTSQHFQQLTSIFSDACPSYIHRLCSEHPSERPSLDDLITKMTICDYPKKPIDIPEVFEHLKKLLPDACPDYLEDQAKILAFKSVAELTRFVEEAIEKHDYPTMEDYLKNQKKNSELSRYTTNYNTQEFLKQFPNPEQFFSDPNRKCPLAQDDPDSETVKNDELYAKTFLYNYYTHLRKKDIDRVFRMCTKSLMTTCTKLDRMQRAFKTARKHVDAEVVSENVPLLQEIAYLQNKKTIKRIIKECDENYRLAKANAKENGLLQTCGCCFDEELIPEECYFCKNGCIFCKDCVKGSSEVAIGEGKLDFPCLADCGSEFSIPTLQMVLESVVFSKMAQRKQMEEIKRANIDGLETCPFCDYATIPPPDSKVFKCLNMDCMKESCRECRHVSHIPLRCNEIEYDEDVKMRTYIENKMTEALLRTCWNCSKVFIKASGCNKMTCSCGAHMCYVCKKRVDNYDHFGQKDSSRCPLYTQDLNKFHNDAVLQGAATAKVELGVDKNPTKLKMDPTKGFQN